jgi:branched-chain amino acid transport system permease protein
MTVAGEVETFVGGVSRGAIYALISLGYTMVYGILGMINFAHGEIYMVGTFAAILTLALLATFGLTALGAGLCLAIGLMAAMLVSAAFGFTNERIAYRPLRRAHALSPLISAIGVSTFLQNFVMNAQTKDKVDFPQHFAEPLWSHRFEFAGTRIALVQIIILIVAVGLMIALHLFISRTKLGKAMRAVAQDKTMAALVGIPIDRVISVTFIIGSALAAAAGTFFALYNGQTRFDAGYTAGLAAFTAAVLGGIGNIPGAMLGGFLIGLVEDFTAYHFGADWKYAAVFAVLMTVLIARPRGLLGEQVAERA